MEAIRRTVYHHMARLARRQDDSKSSSLSPTIQALLIALVVLFASTIALALALLMIRRARRHGRPGLLPTHHRRDHVTITTTPYGRTSTLYLYDEKAPMMSKRSCDADAEELDSPDAVPEIRITFPDEQDESGRRKSGRVVVVRVGEHSVGLEPLRDEEQLPAYEREGKWQSLDMNRIGGLKDHAQA